MLLIKTEKTIIAGVTNGAESAISLQQPYTRKVTVRGVCPLLFNRYNCEAIAEGAKGAKGSAVKKKGADPETLVYRNEAGELSLPGDYLRGAIINAARFKQDPRSPRKSAMDLYKAGMAILTPLASLGVKDWDFLDQRRVVIQRAAVTKSRPAMHEGWEASFEAMVTLPEYISPTDLHEIISLAGRLVGLADFRPSYGRFQIINFE